MGGAAAVPPLPRAERVERPAPAAGVDEAVMPARGAAPVPDAALRVATEPVVKAHGEPHPPADGDQVHQPLLKTESCMYYTGRKLA